MKPHLITGIATVMALACPSLPARANDALDFPAHVQDTAKEVTAEAHKTWRKDAYITHINLMLGAEHVKPHLVFTLYSPSKKIGELVSRGNMYGDYPLPFKANESIDLTPIPDFTVDLPQAIAIAHKNGLNGTVENAYLHVLQPKGKPPILAWVVLTTDSFTNSRRSKVPAIDAYTGAVIPFDQAFDPPSGSDAELIAAAQSLWMALHGRFGGGGGGGGGAMPFAFGSGQVGPNGQVTPGPAYDSGAHDRAVLLDNAYWNGGPDAYNRAQNGESTWSDKCAYGGC